MELWLINLVQSCGCVCDVSRPSVQPGCKQAQRMPPSTGACSAPCRQLE